MRLFGTIFTQQINVEPLVPTDYAVAWPDNAQAQIGVVGSHFYLKIDSNADPALTKVRLDLVRIVDSQVIHTMVFTQGTEGWGIQQGGGIIGLAHQLETVLPVSPSDSASHWFVTQAAGLKVTLTPTAPPGPAAAFSALIVMQLQYIQLTTSGQLLFPPGVAKIQEAVSQTGGKSMWITKSDGTLWSTPDATVPNPTWTQITTP